MSCPGYPVLCVLSCLSCPTCPVLSVLSRSSCPWLSCPWLACPGCPVQVSCPWCHVLGHCPGCLVSAVCLGFPVQDVFSQQSCSRCRFLAVLGCPVQAVLQCCAKRCENKFGVLKDLGTFAYFYKIPTVVGIRRIYPKSDQM